ncbi:ATP-binding cassette subfamily transporter B1 member 4 [Fasciolopsis buskii]|uniref:ATP-binding cassette subfamily transporter B1 member 4 n=1 Tax=Fasciolopsis buskii TaxID=27845 RepID=A0A8E0RN85_9TREM|nr:ATP-binding cassette subfamily transporter B1 member 4 [Fasciolopsis buski]
MMDVHPALSIIWHSSVLEKTPKSTGHQLNRVIWTPLSSMSESGREVLRQVNFFLKPNCKLAIVGLEGAGKSAVFQLLLRHYEPDFGEYFISGVDVRCWNIKKFRERLGFVAEEPVLFEGTIAHNIRLGRLEATDDEIRSASMLTQVHEFIQSLSGQGYDASVTQLSGLKYVVQRWLITLARAVIRNPTLLLLDCPNLPLNRSWEYSILIEAVKRVSTGRTVIIASRYPNIAEDADQILVLDKGFVSQMGTSAELLAEENGLYATMTHVYKPLRTTYFSRTLRENRPELPYIIFGCISSLVAGAAQPSFAVLYSEVFDVRFTHFEIIRKLKKIFYFAVLQIFASRSGSRAMQHRIAVVGGMMALVGVCRLLACAGQGYFFGVSSERLIKRLRIEYFEALMRQLRNLRPKYSTLPPVFPLVNEFMSKMNTVRSLNLEEHYVKLYIQKADELARAFAVMNMGTQSFGRFFDVVPEIQVAYKSAEIIYQTIDRKPKIPKDNGLIPHDLYEFSGRVTFSHVTLKPRDDVDRECDVLKDFSCTINPGQVVGFVGLPGCGRLGIVDLVEQFVHPSPPEDDEQGIYFDYRNIRQLKPSWIRSQCALISYESRLFSRSIKENIAYGLDVNETALNDIIQAARSANVHDLINALPEGYDTVFVNGESQISEGQQRRIALARALFRKPKILLVDRFTTDLDVEDQRLILRALADNMHQYTSIVIPHLFAHASYFDQIIVLRSGQQVESGTFVELSQSASYFKDLLNLEKMNRF